MSRLVLVFFVGAALLLGTWQAALALRCRGNIVSVGDSKFHVQEVCGEPTYIEQRTYALPAFVYDPYYGTTVERTTYVVDEVWTYNFGSGRLIYHLIFRHGRLSRIDTAEHRGR